MTAAAVWQADWRGALIALSIPATFVLVVWWLMILARREDDRRRAETERSIAAIRRELDRRRRNTGWFQSQAYFDAECDCIEIAEAVREAKRQ